MFEVDSSELVAESQSFVGSAEVASQEFATQHAALNTLADHLFSKSRHALVNRSKLWHERSTELTQGVRDQGAMMVSAAQAFESVDQENAALIIATRRRSDPGAHRPDPEKRL